MKISDIVSCAQLACILEVSCPKPGNVNRYYNFRDTKYEHFLAGGIAIGESIEDAASRGYKVGERKLNVRDIGVGKLINEAVHTTKQWHRGRNTNLGTAMLLIPLSAAAGIALSQSKKIRNSFLRENLDLIIKSTTSKDAIFLYRAIRFAEPGGLGRVVDLDVRDRNSDKRIVAENLNLYRLMKITKGDSIAEELTTRMKISFEMGYPAIMQEFHKTEDINSAILYAFIKILSEVPDSLIARKNGIEVAEEVLHEAGTVLKAGLAEEVLENFDKKLRKKDNRLNPGTTADLIASSLMIALLNGLRP